MDVYTTSFTYPRRSRHTHSPASSLDFQQSELRPPSGDSYTPAHHLHRVNSNISDATSPSDGEAVQKLTMLAMQMHGCHVSYFMADQGGWNFYITGAYQQVMLTRGMILKECPIQVCPLRSSRFAMLVVANLGSQLISTVQQSRSLVPKFSMPPLQNLRSRRRSDVDWMTSHPRHWLTLRSSIALLRFQIVLLQTGSAAVQDGRAWRPREFASWLLLDPGTL